MGIFELGKSRAFGNNNQVKKGNLGTNFWGNNIFKFDGSINDKKNLLHSAKTISRLLIGKNVPIRYASDNLEKEVDQSYTDGKTITISSKVDPTTIDSSFGLVCHESSHIKLTDFLVIRRLIDKHHSVPVRFHEYVNFIKNLHNWVEDRRIDTWAFNEKPGFKIYYLELYDRYFYCKEIEEALTKHGQELSNETGRNYEFFICNSLHPKVNMDELKGLPEIKNIIDIDNIERLTTTEQTLQVTYDIMDVILKNIPDEEKEKINNVNVPLNGGISDKDLSDLIKKILEMQESLGNGTPMDFNGKTIKIKIDASNEKLVDALEAAETEILQFYDDEKGDYTVVTVNHIDEAAILSDLYEIFDTNKHHESENKITTGFKLGTMLGRKLQIRNDERTLKTVRLKSGKIDKRMLHAAGGGNYDIFQTVKFDRYNDIAVHLSIDMSGSMRGKKWYQTLTGLVAISKACSMVKGIRVQISLRYGGNLTNNSNWSDGDYSDEAIVINFYDSAHDNINKLNLLAYANPAGSTPEGVCFEGLAKKIMKPLMNQYTLFINFSDGAPGMHSISTIRGVEITKNAIKRFKGLGMNILSYFISSGSRYGSEEQYFTDMYGKEAAFVDVENILELAKTINKNFLKMGK